MNIPVVTGTGERLELDTDDYPRLVLLPEACDEIDPRLWDLFAQERDGQAESWMMTSRP